mgnify:CR=1 FL=1
MKNKGFTLIELLGVIIILALLMIIVFPSIINSVKNSSNKTDDLTKELIYNAADLFIDEHINDFPKMNGSKYSIELSTLVGEGLLTGPIKLSSSDADITNNKCIQVTYNNGYNYELKDSGTCVETIKYSLPEEYQQVEYIESTGEQIINSEVITSDDVGMYADFYIESSSVIMGSRSDNENNTRFWINPSSMLYYGWNTSKTLDFNSLNARVVIELNLYNNRKVVAINRTTQSSMTAVLSETLSSSNTANIGLFGHIINNGTYTGRSSKIYRSKITKSNIIFVLFLC